jgi:hypothetical protein
MRLTSKSHLLPSNEDSSRERQTRNTQMDCLFSCEVKEGTRKAVQSDEQRKRGVNDLVNSTIQGERRIFEVQDVLFFPSFL